MKKFLKVFIVVLLVLGVIGGTAYFFFTNLEEENRTTPSIVAMLKSDDKLAFNTKLDSVSYIVVNSNSSDKRIELLIETNEKLDDIVYSLSTYFINSNTEVESKELSKQYKKLVSSRELLGKMMDEYLIKKNSTYFNKHLGANDLYVQACSYLVDYSNFANTLNKIVSNKKLEELKFNMFELYSNVVASTFNKSKVEENDSNWTVVSSTSNIDIMNSALEIRNNHIVKIKNEVATIVNSSDSNSFNNYYNKCNKKSFANNLSVNISAATSSTQSTNEGYAAYYFKGIYEI